MSGDFVSAWRSPKTCSSNADCSGSSICEDLWRLSWKTEPLISTDTENALLDFYRDTLGTLIYSDDPGDNKDQLIERNMKLSTLQGHARRMLLILGGNNAPETMTSSSLKFCFPNLDNMANAAEAKVFDEYDEFDETWLMNNLLPKINGKTMEDSLLSDACMDEIDGCFPGKEKTKSNYFTGDSLYWTVTVPQLDTSGALKFPGEELEDAMVVSFTYIDTQLSSCDKFDAMASAAFKSALATSVGSNTDPAGIKIDCSEASRRLQDATRHGRLLSKGVELSVQIRNVPPGAQAAVKAKVVEVQADPTTFMQNLNEHKAALGYTAIDVEAATSVMTEYVSNLEFCSENGETKCKCASTTSFVCDGLSPSEAANITTTIAAAAAEKDKENAEETEEQIAATGTKETISVEKIAVTSQSGISNDNGSDDDLNIGAIVGGVVGALFGLCLLVALFFYCKKHSQEKEEPVPAATLEGHLEKRVESEDV
jgi:hypothetical protein